MSSHPLLPPWLLCRPVLKGFGLGLCSRSLIQYALFLLPAVFPDEFDGLMRLLRPWLKLSPSERLRRLSEAEHRRPGQEGLNETTGKQNLVRLISDGMGGLGVSQASSFGCAR